jgi:hypothetical protein
LADKAASLATMEEHLRQERVAHQQAEAQLQQELTSLAEARAALEREHLAWKRPRAGSSKSAPHLRGRRRPSNSGTKRSCSSTRS